jgi:hypothetical protein
MAGGRLHLTDKSNILQAFENLLPFKEHGRVLTRRYDDTTPGWALVS